MPWYSYALIAAVGISVVSLVQKRTLRQEHSLEYAMLFSVAKVAIFLPLFWSHIAWHITGSQALWLVLGASFGSAGFLWVVKAIKRLELSAVSPLLALEPGLVAVLAVAALGETISGRATLGLGLLVVGTYLLEVFQLPAGWWQATPGATKKLTHPFRHLVSQRGGWYVVLGLLSYTVSALIARHVLGMLSSTTYLGYDFLIGAIIYVGLFVWRRQPIAAFRSGSRYLVGVIVLIAIFHIGQSAAQATAMKLAPIGLVIAIKRTSVLLDVAIAGRLFHEHNLRKKFVATLMIVAGAIMIAVP